MDIRKNYIKKYNQKNPSVLKFIELGRSKDATVFNNLCKVYEEFEKRVYVLNVLYIIMCITNDYTNNTVY